MYSMVLMAALTTGGQTPDWCFHASCGGYNCGCYGCWGNWGSYGYSYYTCFGSGYGCYGGCHGCYGYGGCWSCNGGCVGSPYAPSYTSPGTVMPPAPDGGK